MEKWDFDAGVLGEGGFCTLEVGFAVVVVQMEEGFNFIECFGEFSFRALAVFVFVNDAHGFYSHTGGQILLHYWQGGPFSFAVRFGL